jgi:hypothetical protein
MENSRVKDRDPECTQMWLITCLGFWKIYDHKNSIWRKRQRLILLNNVHVQSTSYIGIQQNVFWKTFKLAFIKKKFKNLFWNLFYSHSIKKLLKYKRDLKNWLWRDLKNLIRPKKFWGLFKYHACSYSIQINLKNMAEVHLHGVFRPWYDCY